MMDTAGRNYLTGSILLSRDEDGNFPEEYFIKSVIGEGGSSVCYEAARRLPDGGEETGKLKEFYPADSVSGDRTWYFSLERLPDGQLVPGAGATKKFREMCEDYLGTYRLMKKVMADNPENEVLKNYIQHGEILYGCREKQDGDDRKPTVYIWSSGVAGKGFDTYLAEVRENPSYRPEERLRDILCVMNALTDCVKALHTAGLLHLDIKPSNFLVPYNSDFKIRPDNISLFDINTLCSVDSGYMRVFGTEGYCAPEILKGRADNRSDIYSIGAMLFYAVVISKEITDGLYRDRYYSGIDQFVRHSELFRSSETNSDAALMSGICRILENCLAKDPRKRYQSCSELKEDLEKVRDRLNRMLWMPTEKSGDGLTDPTIVIQKLLYEHPLYEAVGEKETDVNVLVLGSGTYGQRFTDICLQSGQMAGRKLHITALSDEPEADRTAYLRFRPAMPEFVNVNGSLQGREERAYADLEFQGLSPESPKEGRGRRFGRNIQRNRELVREILREKTSENRRIHYIFAALGDDQISRTIAALCLEELQKEQGQTCPVCYVSQSGERRKETDPEQAFYAVCINEPVDLETIEHHLGQMAFQTHMSWNRAGNIEIAREREEFFTGKDEKNRYNRTSSLSYALSVKYKLHSVQIDCEDPQKAAELFSERILERRFSDPEARKAFDRLVELEHRRWVLEKAADGWRAPRDGKGRLKLEECVLRGSVRDAANRTHPCMVHSTGTSPLQEPEYTENHHARWDEGEIDPALDELDRMSIELHRCFRRYARQLKEEGLYQNADLLFIQNRIPAECTEASRAFQQFQFVLKNILNGVESYSLQYEYYQNILQAALKEVPEEMQERIRERLEVITKTFYPVIESNLYRNYKANDEVLVEKIPFILSYQYAPVIAAAFEDGKYQNGRNEAIFGNVAAATILNPEKMRYLYCFYKDSHTELLISRVEAVLRYFEKRRVRCEVELAVVCMEEVSEPEREALLRELDRLQRQAAGRPARLSGAEIFMAGKFEEAAEIFSRYLEENPADLYDAGNQLFPSVYDNAVFFGKLAGRKMPYFELDWRNKTFVKYSGCEYLRFVKDSSFLRIQDMFALMNAAGQRAYLPEFAEDYETLWQIYTGQYLEEKKFENGVKNWNRMCLCLQEYENQQKPLARIALCKEQELERKTYTWFLPEYTFPTVRTLLKKLMEYKVAGKESGLVHYTSDTCRLDLVMNQAYEQQMGAVFANPQMLLAYYGTDAYKYEICGAEYVEIRCCNLKVENAELDLDGNGSHKYVYEVLRQLEQAHFISQLTRNPDHVRQVSFVYSSPRMKKLLTAPGRILEIYAYYDVLKTGYFDDVACGYEFYWEPGGVKNELDLVLTKGFRSVIAECKAVVELKPDYYHKLHSIADQFGIGTVRVLLGNTYARSDQEANDLNALERSRGDRLSIRTISDEEEILHIGQTLKRLMEEAVSGQSADRTGERF